MALAPYCMLIILWLWEIKINRYKIRDKLHLYDKSCFIFFRQLLKGGHQGTSTCRTSGCMSLEWFSMLLQYLFKILMQLSTSKFWLCLISVPALVLVRTWKHGKTQNCTLVVGCRFVCSLPAKEWTHFLPQISLIAFDVVAMCCGP